MRKSALLLALLLTASFATVGDAARKKTPAPPKDPAYEWNVKHMPPQAAPGAAAPAKAAMKSKKKAKKAAKKGAKKAAKKATKKAPKKKMK